MLKKCRFLPKLETERLILRELTVEDTDDLKDWITRDDIYTYWGRPANKEENDPDLFFANTTSGKKRRLTNDYIWWIELKSINKIIGEIEIYDIKDKRFGMLGYRISPDFWNKGICSESINRVIKYVFSETCMDRLQANVDVRNTASNKALEKCGFIHEGTVRHGKMISTYCNYNIWGLLRDDVRV